MKITSINIGKAQPIDNKSGSTGIYKNPTSDPVTVNKLGLHGDTIVDTKHHGGVDQAIYIYGVPDYDWWSEEIKRELPAGIFGENITISDLVSSELCIGDTLTMGTVILQVTSPRIPCATFAKRMDDPKFVKKFVNGERYGAYCRVLQTGTIQVGDAVEIHPYDGDRIPLNYLADVYYSKNATASDYQRLLSVPVAIRNRDEYEEALAKLS